MKTITLVTIALDAYAILFGLSNPISYRRTIELNEHVNRRKNE